MTEKRRGTGGRKRGEAGAKMYLLPTVRLVEEKLQFGKLVVLIAHFNLGKVDI